MSVSLQPVTHEQAVANRQSAARSAQPRMMLAMLAGLATVIGASFLGADIHAVPAWITVLIAAPLTIVGALGARSAMTRVRYRITVFLSGLRLIGILAGAALLIWGLGELSMALGLTWGWSGLRVVMIVALLGALQLHLATSTLFNGDCTQLRFRNTTVPWDTVAQLVIAPGRKPETLEIGAVARPDRPVTPMPVRADETLTDLPFRTVVRRQSLDLDRLRWVLNQSGRTDLTLVERGPAGQRVIGYANRPVG